jgi:hypothetical protein
VIAGWSAGQVGIRGIGQSCGIEPTLSRPPLAHFLLDEAALIRGRSEHDRALQW